MEFSIIGYGRMGKAVEFEIDKLGFSVSKILCSTEDIYKADFSPDEVAIEFTSPASFASNIKALADKGVNVVSGTTGVDVEFIKNLVLKQKIGFLHSSNFAMGMQIFFQLVKNASKIFNNFRDYDVCVRELHHRKKKDMPSGTALDIGKILLNYLDSKKDITCDLSKVKEDTIHISGSRGGGVIGEHDVIFDGIHDTIRISHTSKSRSIYASGAVSCAIWLNGKKGFFSVNDYVKDFIK